MKSRMLALVTISTFVLSSLAFAAGRSDQKDGTARIKILTPIVLSADQDLQFSEAAVGDAAESIPASDAAKAAQFSVTGESAKSFSIGVPASVTMKKGAGGANKEIEVTLSPSAASGTLTGGAASFSVGGSRALIPAGQEEGDYVGLFPVTVQYL